MSRPSPSGRSAVWRRAAWPCTLGRPGVQVAKGSSDLISSSLTGGRGGSRTFESVSVGGRLPGRLALTSPAPLVEARDRLDSSLFFFSLFLPYRSTRERDQSRLPSSHPRERQAETIKTTADGGSLGSRVDEERSQLRESM